MDTLIRTLQEAGVVCVISEEEAENTRFGVIFGPGPGSLDDPRDRFNEAAIVLRSWKDKTPILQEPGRSLCKSCTNIDIDTLCSTEGYIHSECYWALVASAEVSKCPMCVLMINALRGGCHNFDAAMKIQHPHRTDLQVCLRTTSKGKRIERQNLEVMILNLPFLPPGKLFIFTAPGMNTPRTSLQSYC
jgi:hypothetical protein